MSDLTTERPGESGGLAELLPILEELARRKATTKLLNYRPYPKFGFFHDAGAKYKERAAIAANQVGKSWAGSMEMAYHLTGLYPVWWKGRRFDTPVEAWAAGVTNLSTKDNVQNRLLGKPGEFGTGAIPEEMIDKGSISMSRSCSNLVDSLRIRHRSGGWSWLSFKSYEQGFEKWQGPSLHVVWLDEEPPEDIYNEALARTTATKGIVFLTFTPLLGMSTVAGRFLHDSDKDRRYSVNLTLYDAEHLTPEEQESEAAKYKPHEREARVYGRPSLGEGAVFPVEEEMLAFDLSSFKGGIPRHWARLNGLDIGFDHPTAVAFGAWDRDNDVLYIYDAYKQRGQSVPVHASAIRQRGAWIPVAWPHDALQHDKGSGVELATQYKREGVTMLPERAQFLDGSFGVEAGVSDMLNRMLTGRLRVARHLGLWWDEFRLYHRKEGKIVKENDDLLSATRYLIMSLRFARTEDASRKMSARRKATPQLEVV